jgi:regulator of sirC expression with transglutaminase-like and TPR domain
MQEAHAARRRFVQLLRLPEAELSLAEAALCISWEDQQRAEPLAELGMLDAFAAAVTARFTTPPTPSALFDALNSYFFNELGFRGNTWNYNDPKNSFLDQVLTTRAGLPITLSVIYLELGWRLGLPVAGLALPGHFLVQVQFEPQPIYLDPFNRGRHWSRVECERQIRAAYGTLNKQLFARVMAPPSKRDILARMLRNIKHAYMELGLYVEVLATIERVLLIEPKAGIERRDRGLAYAQLGQLHRALIEFERYAALAPGAKDLAQIRTQVRQIAEQITLIN